MGGSKYSTDMYHKCRVYLINPNTIKSYKILQKLSPKHAAHGVAQSTYPNYRHGKACLSKQPPWRAAGDPRLPGGRSRVRAPGPAGALRALFFSTLPSFLLPEIVFFAPSPPTPQKCYGYDNQLTYFEQSILGVIPSSFSLVVMMRHFSAVYFREIAGDDVTR